MFDNYAVLYKFIFKQKNLNYEIKKEERKILYLYGLKSASKLSGKSKITLICVPWDISPRKKI